VWKRRERLREVTRTQFGGSTSATREGREPKQLLARRIRRHRSE
jgi:hypothetical protein